MLVRRVWPSRPTVETPFGDPLRQMLRLLDSVGSESFGEVGAGVFPPMNVTQDSENFYVRAEVPGMEANKLSVSVKKSQLAISGRREIAREPERVSHHRKERVDGAFSRTLTLPSEIDSERVDARYTDGILTLTLPKAEQAKARQIAVKT
jgi:HSP20 family protein